MLYLAEVKKQTRSFLGTKAEIKLLACQRNDQTWSAVPGEEIKEAEEASNFENGTLILVDLGTNRQVQGKLEPAASKLVSILQSLSKVLEKSKGQEEEIEQWKQSLTYQSQELSRREMEMEGRIEQLEQMQEEFERLEQQRQEIEQSKAEAEKLRQDFERKSAELEGAWEQLRGQQRRLEEQEGEISQGAVLDAEVSAQLQGLMTQLLEGEVPTGSLWEQVNQALEVVNRQQESLSQNWQQLEQERKEAEQKQAEAEQQEETLKNTERECQEVQTSLEEARRELQQQQQNLAVKQESCHLLRLQLQNQQELYERLSRLAVSSSDMKLSQEVDINALESMPLGELQEIVDNLQQDLERMVRFVNDQEEELTLERQDMEKIEAQIQEVSEYDRLSLEQDLSEIRDRYQMLDETLVGQRRNLREREEVYSQHRRVLLRRKGIVDTEGDYQKIDLSPILQEVEDQRSGNEEELQKLENQIEQMQASIQQAQGMIDEQSQEQTEKREEIERLEESWREMQVSAQQLWSRVKMSEETLQPLQDSLNEVQQQLEEVTSLLSQMQTQGEAQKSAIAQMREVLNTVSS